MMASAVKETPLTEGTRAPPDDLCGDPDEHTMSRYNNSWQTLEHVSQVSPYRQRRSQVSLVGGADRIPGGE